MIGHQHPVEQRILKSKLWWYKHVSRHNSILKELVEAKKGRRIPIKIWLGNINTSATGLHSEQE